ncbi:unnamed protein product [Brassica rapa subsp. narinosa]
MAPPHFLLVTLPAQGHANPSLRFAHRLIRTTGARVTLATCHSVFHCSNIQSHDNVFNLSLLTFSDGFDDGVISNTEDVQNRLLNLERNGDKTLSEFIEANKNGDSPVACVIYTILPSWVPRLARRFHLPSVLLWIQPALAFQRDITPVLSSRISPLSKPAIFLLSSPLPTLATTSHKKCI